MEDQEVPAVEQEVNPLDDFDLRSPAQVVADEANAPKEEPVVEEPQEEPAPAKEGEDLTEEQPAEETVEEKKPYQAPQRVRVEVPPFEKEIPRDEYGNIDPEKFGEYLQERDAHLKAVAQAEAQNAFYDTNYLAREWDDVGQAHPELVKDESLRNMVENLRTADAIRGGEGNLMVAAEQIAQLMQSKVEEGRAAAQTTITRQKSVSLPSSPRSQNTEATKLSDLRKQAVGGNESARLAYITALHERGEL